MTLVVPDFSAWVRSMASIENKSINLKELIAHLNQDRAFLLEAIDKGNWPEYRNELAALERELNQLLTIAAEKLQSDS